MDEAGKAPREKWWRRKPMAASGILRVKTGFLTHVGRDHLRPKIWRPPLALNLGLLAFALIAGTGAVAHRRSLDSRLANLFGKEDVAPFQIKRIREDLAEQEMDERTLSRELDARLKYARAQEARDFYIVLDTKNRKFAFKYGDKVLRDGALEVGAPETIPGGREKSRISLPLTGAFNVQQKLEEPAWKAPGWIYTADRLKPPDPLPAVPGGLGKYVLVFSDDYVIHTPPPPQGPLKGVRPGSFMVSEGDLAAIWRRIGPGTRIYIF